MRHGFLLIDKPEGPTSHDMVALVRRTLSERKVGHLGTLDPAASGLLVLAVGAKALKVVELFNQSTKEYIADIVFGTTSATYDREGPLSEYPRKPGVPDPDQHAVLEQIRTRFVGKISQVPPLASAISVDGERAYHAMRQGREVELPKRTVEISRCDILQYSYPELSLRIACGSGTYIRSLAHDLGQSLRVGAYLSALRRTKVGRWSVDDAAKPDAVKWTDVLPLKEVLADRERLDLNDADFEHLCHGRCIAGLCALNTIGWHEGLPVALLEQKAENEIKARKVL